MARRRPERFVEPLVGMRLDWGDVMWVLDFCVKHSSECVHMAEECTDAEQIELGLHLPRSGSNSRTKSGSSVATTGTRALQPT